jgi:hypothetical protein
MMLPEEMPQPAGRWAKPSPLGYGAAMDSLGTVASPLLWSASDAAGVVAVAFVAEAVSMVIARRLGKAP